MGPLDVELSYRRRRMLLPHLRNLDSEEMTGVSVTDSVPMPRAPGAVEAMQRDLVPFGVLLKDRTESKHVKALTFAERTNAFFRIEKVRYSEPVHESLTDGWIGINLTATGDGNDQKAHPT